MSAIWYGDDVADDADLRLCGDVAGKRVIELGIAASAELDHLAEAGAKAIALDPSAERSPTCAPPAERAEVHVECHQGDLADLGFATSASVDLVFAAHTLDRVDDLPRLLRQVHRVLKPGAPFVFSIDPPGRADVRRRRRRSPSRTAPTAARSAICTALDRTNFHLDAIHELNDRPHPRALVPAALVLRPASRALAADAGATAHQPPRQQAAADLVLAERALVEAHLEQERQRLADDPARADAEVLHHRVAVELGPDRRQLLLLAQLGDARLELVHAPRQLRRLALVARRAVAAGEHVQLVEQRRRRRARSGARPSRSSPSGRCGSAGAGRPARLTASTSSLE